MPRPGRSDAKCSAALSRIESFDESGGGQVCENPRRFVIGPPRRDREPCCVGCVVQRERGKRALLVAGQDRRVVACAFDQQDG
jgi:hypothetical protein